MANWGPPERRQQISRVPYLPGLDGLRAIAVAAVMVYHANHGWLSGGFLGVEVFFVISGYLITLLIIGEHERDGRISLKGFWKRRAKRLLPALYVMLAGVVVYMALFNKRPLGQTRGDFAGGIFYVSNWYQIFVGQGYTASEAFVPLRHLWSLAVEEQFYLIWPLVMLLILRRGRDKLPRTAVWLAGVSVLIAIVMAVAFKSGDIELTCDAGSMHGYFHIFGRCMSVNDTLYLNTFSRAGGLMLGAAFAMVWRPYAVMRGPMRNKGRLLDLLALCGLGGLGLLAWNLYVSKEGTNFGIRYDPWLFRGGFLLVGAGTLFVIAAATHQRSLVGKALGMPVLNWIGTRSYGLYLFHWPIYQIIRHQAGTALGLGQFILAMAITLPVTELSYRFVEMPIRRGTIREWLHSQGRPRSAAVYKRRQYALLGSTVVVILLSYAGASIALAPNECVGQNECDFQAGEKAIDATTSTTVPGATSTTLAPTTTTARPGITEPGEATGPTVPPATTVAPTTVPPTTLPSNQIAPYAIGESVMLGAAPNLAAGGITVNAEVSRQGAKVAEIVGQLRAGGQLGRIVIIQIGTNGSVSDETLNAIMSALPPDQTPLVVFLTVRANRNWVPDNNTRIRRLPQRFPNVKVLDWETLSNQIAGELASDGIHLRTPVAKQFYANLIFDAIGRPDLKK